MKRTREQVASVKEEPRTPGKGEALVRELEGCKSLCTEHNRDHKEYDPEEDFAEGEKEERLLDKKFRGRAYALDK